jgi:hypothetical protein
MAAAQHRVKVGAAPDHACMDITAAAAAAASPSDGRASAINCVHASLASPNGATARRAAIRRSTTETRFVRYGLCVHGAETLLCYYTTIAIHQSRSWTELCCILDVSVAHANILPHAVNFLHLPGGSLEIAKTCLYSACDEE